MGLHLSVYLWQENAVYWHDGIIVGNDQGINSGVFEHGC